MERNQRIVRERDESFCNEMKPTILYMSERANWLAGWLASLPLAAVGGYWIYMCHHM